MSRATSRVPTLASTSAPVRWAHRSTVSRSSVSVWATPAGEESVSSSRRSASRSGPSRQRIVGSLSPTPRGSKPTTSKRRPTSVEASDVERYAAVWMPEAPGPPGLITSDPMRSGEAGAAWRSTAIVPVRPCGCRVVERHLHPRALQRGVRVDSGGPPRWRRTARRAPTRGPGRRRPRARAGRSRRGRAPRRPGRPAHTPRAGGRRSPRRPRRGPSDDGGAGSRWIARRSPCHGPRDRPVTGRARADRRHDRCPTSHCEAGPSGRPGAAAVRALARQPPDDPGTRRARWASRQGRTTMTSPDTLCRPPPHARAAPACTTSRR